MTKDEHSGLFVPAFWVFMNSKRKDLYDSFFSKIKQWFSTKYKVTLQPDEIIADFELGLQLSLKEQFQKSKIRGCYFHLLQSWWRKGLVSKKKES